MNNALRNIRERDTKTGNVQTDDYKHDDDNVGVDDSGDDMNDENSFDNEAINII